MSSPSSDSETISVSTRITMVAAFRSSVSSVRSRAEAGRPLVGRSRQSTQELSASHAAKANSSTSSTVAAAPVSRAPAGEANHPPKSVIPSVSKV